MAHVFPDLDQYTLPTATIDNFKLSDLPKKTVITINADDPIEKGMKTIFSNKILSCPVLSASGDLLGSISIIDIVLFTINVCQSSQELVSAFGLPVTNDNLFVNFDNVPNLLRTDASLQSSGFNLDKASFLTNFSRRNSLHVLPGSSSLVDVAKILQKSHRIAVGDKKLENYVSQSELVKFLYQNKLYHNGSHSVKDLNLGTKKVISMGIKQLVIEGFKQMIVNKISGVGVVDEDGQLVGVVSAHDVRVIGNSADLLEHLYSDYPTYRVYLQNNFQVPSAPITVSESDTLDKVITTLLENKIHRVFIVDNYKKPIGVISFGDVLEKMLLKN